MTEEATTTEAGELDPTRPVELLAIYAKYRLALNRRASYLLYEATHRYAPAGKHSLRGWEARVIHGAKGVIDKLEAHAEGVAFDAKKRRLERRRKKELAADRKASLAERKRPARRKR